MPVFASLLAKVSHGGFKIPVKFIANFIKEFNLLARYQQILRTVLGILGGSRYGVVVRALVFHQCDAGSIPGPGVICGLSLLLVLVLAARVLLRAFRFSSLHKNQHFLIPIRSGRQVFTHEPLEREIRRLLPPYDVKFDLI